MNLHGWDGIEDPNRLQWTRMGALFYSIIVITTIGMCQLMVFVVVCSVSLSLCFSYIQDNAIQKLHRFKRLNNNEIAVKTTPAIT